MTGPRTRRSQLHRLRDEAGVTAVEYGLLITLVALALLVGAAALGDGLNDFFALLGAKLTSLVP